MACTTHPLSPESRKPLHTQVHNLREERINLLENVRSLRADRDQLTAQLGQASQRISEMEARLDDGDAKRASLRDECAATKQSAAMHETIAGQLRAEASAWQARLTHAESEHTRLSDLSERDRKQTADQVEQEKFRVLGELAAAQADKRAAEEQWRQVSAEASRVRQVLEAQRDEALGRAARAEEQLSIALQEKVLLSHKTHATQEVRAPGGLRLSSDGLTMAFWWPPIASDCQRRPPSCHGQEKAILEMRADASDKRAADAMRRTEEMSQVAATNCHPMAIRLPYDCHPMAIYDWPPVATRAPPTQRAEAMLAAPASSDCF